MTQPDTLHDRIRAEIERRLEVAKAATPPPWNAMHYGVESEVWSPELHRVTGRPMWEVLRSYVAGGVNTHAAADAEHIALHDPADAVRRYEGELEVLERHTWLRWLDGLACSYCEARVLGEAATVFTSWPCDEIKSLMHRLGVDS